LAATTSASWMTGMISAAALTRAARPAIASCARSAPIEAPATPV